MTSPTEQKLQNARRQSLLHAAVSGVSGLIVLGSLAFGGWHIKTAEERVKGLKDTSDSLSKVIAAKAETLAAMSPVAARGLGYKDWSSVKQAGELASSLDAKRAVDSLSHAPSATRAAVTVNAYVGELARVANATIVEETLKRTGFKVVPHERAARIGDVPINCVWYGSGVSRQDVQAVALSLASAGVELRCIKPFADPNGPKRLTIEIGGSRAESRSAVLSPEAILAGSFARR